MGASRLSAPERFIYQRLTQGRAKRSLLLPRNVQPWGLDSFANRPSHLPPQHSAVDVATLRIRPILHFAYSSEVGT